MSKFKLDRVFSNTTPSPSLIKLLPALFLLMFYLKATGAVTWSWWVVWSPIWGAAIAAVALVAIIVGLGYWLGEDWMNTDE